MWLRWNQTTHILEKSDNNGSSWTPLGLHADTITEGVIAAARLPTYGTWVDVGFNAADYTATTGTWAVTSGNVVGFRYMMLGTVGLETMFIQFLIVSTSPSAITAKLKIKIPNSRVAAVRFDANGQCSDNGGVTEPMSMLVNIDGTVIELAPLDGSSWAIGSSNTAAFGTMFFKVKP